jgi:predicted RNA binding protein YcfA (HicA-like mRNA interferase family)
LLHLTLESSASKLSKGDQISARNGSRMKVRDVIRLLEEDGWMMVAQKGSHRQFRHPIKPGKVTVPGQMSQDLPVGTFKSILRQAGLKA